MKLMPLKRLVKLSLVFYCTRAHKRRTKANKYCSCLTNCSFYQVVPTYYLSNVVSYTFKRVCAYCHDTDYVRYWVCQYWVCARWVCAY